jgi:putative transposase
MVEPPVPLTALSEGQRAQAYTRFTIIRPALEDGVTQAQVARTHDISKSTIQRWVKRYREHGLAGLADAQVRSDKGKSRRLPAEAVTLIEGLALQTPPRSIAAIHRQVCTLARERGWEVPSYASVYRIIKKLDPALLTLAHQGAAAYREEYDLLYRREATHSNAMWQADHTPLDIVLLDEAGKPARPWLTVIEDDYSRAIASFRLTFQEPTALTTALALRTGIWRKEDPHWHICGIPSVFYTDHGSDFTSVNELFLQDIPGYAPKGYQAEARLSLPVFEHQFRTWLLSDYQHRVHSETTCTPAQRWEAGGFLPRMPDSPERLDLLLLTVAKTRRVQQDGIRFQGYRYLDSTLAGYVKEDVLIRYDPADLAEIHVFHQDRIVCRAICQELAGQTVSLKEIEKARVERRKQVRAGLATRKEVVERFIAVHQEEAPKPRGSVPEPEMVGRPRLKGYINE